MSTIYRLLTGRELKEVAPDSDLVWPTIVAERDGTTVGRVGTLDYDQMVVAGNLWIAPGVTPRVALRLSQMYEIILQPLGLREYLFSVGVGDHLWKRAVERIGVCEHVEEVEGFTWYRRRIRE